MLRTMPSTRCAPPQTQDNVKRTRSIPDMSVATNQSKKRKTKQVTAKTETEANVETVKRGRGRPRKGGTPDISSQRGSDGTDRISTAGREKISEKHKKLIEVEINRKQDNGHSSYKHSSDCHEDKTLEGDTSDISGLKRRKMKKLQEFELKSIDDGMSHSIQETADILNKPNPLGPSQKKRGKKSKPQSLRLAVNIQTGDGQKFDESPIIQSGAKIKYASEKHSKGNESDNSVHPEKGEKDIKSHIGTSPALEVTSPRRSGRGTIPNSRYKDMHLFTLAKKHCHNPTVKTGKEKEMEEQEDDSSNIKKGSVPMVNLDENKSAAMVAESPKLSMDSKGKDKTKHKSFSSGATIARAQAKAQQQAESKGKVTEKFSIREIERGLEVTGRDGIPVVVAPENIVRVPLPDKAPQQLDKSMEITNNVRRNDTNIPLRPKIGDEMKADSKTGVVTDLLKLTGCEDKAAASSMSEERSEEKGLPDPTISVNQDGSSIDVVEIVEVVETDQKDGPRESVQDQSSGDFKMVTVRDSSPSASQGQSQQAELSVLEVAQLAEGKSSINNPAQSAPTENGSLTMMAKMTDEGNAVVVVDRTKLLPHQFLKETLSSMPPAKPGYVISSPRRNSSVVKIVTLSSMLEETKSTVKKEPNMSKVEVTSQEALPTSTLSVNILQPENSSPPQSSLLETASCPSGVDMILAGSKTVEIDDICTRNHVCDTSDQGSDGDISATHIKKKTPEEFDVKPPSGRDSKFSSTSTQTPIDRESEKTIIPTIYKPSGVQQFKTISVNLGKRELQMGEVGFENAEPGTKTKSEEYILVELPEGATVQQRYVKSRTKIDDSMFLSTESMVQGIYHCTLCNYETNKKANWYKHKRKHMGLREYECSQCSYRAATSSNLKRHLAIHEDLRAFPCSLCSLSFRQKIHLERHIKYKHEEKQIKCPFCDYMCANENPDLKVHIKRKHLPAQSADGTINAFACPECKLVTISRKDLKQHMKFHRKGPELKLFCEHCSFVTDCESRLRRHELIHTKEKPFQCGLCEYRGSQKEHVLRHMRSVHNIDVARRKRKFTSEDGPTDSSQVNIRDLSKLIDKSDYSTKDKIFACNHCTMKFSKLINLYKHLHTQHRSIMPSEEGEDFSCVVCDFRTNSKKNLLVHMRKHNMNDHSPPSHLYSCVLCRYTNPKRRNLFQHMRKKHRIEIVMKDDGSTSCFVTDTSNIQEDVEHNVLTVGDVVTATTADSDSQDDPTGVQSVISLEDLATLVAPEPNQDCNFVIDTGQLQNTSLSSFVQQHEAAEAIEGLQALAGQINLADSVIEEVHVMDDPALDPITMETVETSKEGNEDKSSIELSAEHLINLSSGDYVEINGEMYKVEISGDDSAKATPASLSNVQHINQPDT